MFQHTRARYGGPSVVLSLYGFSMSEPVMGVPLRDRRGRVRAYVSVDASDYEWAMQWQWHLSQAGYAVRNPGIYLHRELLGLAKGDGMEVDHINGTPLDCTRENLRAGERYRMGNQQNRSPGGNRGSTSKYRGVSYQRQIKRWKAQAGYTYIGVFKTEEEARDAVVAWRKEHMPLSREEDA